MDSANKLPVAVIGAGPVGLAAAAHLLERDMEPLIFEAGPHRRGPGRAHHLRVEHHDGETRDHTVAAVIDASGTWSPVTRWALPACLPLAFASDRYYLPWTVC